MKTVCLTPSANWYSAGALSSDGDKLLVGCARQALLLAGPVPPGCQPATPGGQPAILGGQTGTPGCQPSLQCHGVIEDAHRERATGAVVWRTASDIVSVVSCGEDGAVKLWRCEFTEEENKFQAQCERQHNAHGKQKVAAVTHSRLCPHVAISVDERGTFVVWDTVAHTTRTLFLERMAPTELRCSPHSEHVVAVAGKRGLLWTVSLAASGRILQKLRGHDDDVTSISWCPELTTLLSFEQDHLLVSASKDKTLRVWGTRGGRCHVTQRVPAAEGGSRRQGGGGERAWLAVLWARAECIYSSGLTGQLLRWRLGEGNSCQIVHRCHGRSLFNIVPLGPLVVSSGIDRQLAAHDPASLLTGTVPCLGGQAAALHSCPVDPGRLAVGCGDHTVRVWNLGADTAYSTVSIWQGIRAKVLTVAWHPDKDSRLAFGTEEGRVGVCDPSSASRAPQLCPDHHSGPVYSVLYSPSGQLYSVSLGAVWRHDSARLAALSWPPAAGRAPVSQLSFGAGGAALGRQDGAVQLVTEDGVVRGAAIGHRRLVTVLRWCPREQGGRTKLAVGSYDTHVSVFEVPDLGGSGCPELLQARVTLTGHRSRVLDLAWLPDDPSQLVSASQDATVRVWDTVSGSPLAVYSGHRRPVRCCLPHPLLPGRVFSGGDDCSLHLWRIAEQGRTVIDSVSSERASTPSAPTTREKSRSRAGQAGDGPAVSCGTANGEEETGTAASAAVQPRELGDGRKSRTQRSLFPLTSAAENRGKAHSQADLEHLMTGGDGCDPGGDDCKHLGLFRNDAALREMIDMEMSHHAGQRSSAQLLHMSVWRGDAAAVISRAADEALLTDELLALAPMVSYRFWEEMSLKYAQQLENSKECLRASSILLACHRVTEAVELLERHGLYREAVCVSRLRLPPEDPCHGRLLRRWADQLTADGNMEQAAKCYLRLGDRAAAAGALSRRSDPASLRLAARLWAEAGDLTQARTLGLLCLHASCLRADWDVGRKVAGEVAAVAAGAHLCIAHRVLSAELERSRDQLYPWAVSLLRARDERVTGAGTQTERRQGTENPAAQIGTEAGTEQPRGEMKRKDRSAAREDSDSENHSKREEVECDTAASQQAERADTAPPSSQDSGADRLLTQIREAWRKEGIETGEQRLRHGLELVAYSTLPTSPKQLWLSVCSELCVAASESDPAASVSRLAKLPDLCQRTVPSQLPLLCTLLVPAPSGDIWESSRQYVLSAVLSVLYQKSLLPDDQSPTEPSSSDSAGVAPSTDPSSSDSAGVAPPTDHSSSDSAGVAPPTTNGEKSQYTAAPLDGSDGTNSDKKPECSSGRGVTNGEHSGDSVSDGSSVSAGIVPSARSAASAQDVTSGEGDAGVASSDDAELADCVRRLKALYVSEKSEEEEKMLSELEERLKVEERL